MRSRTHNPSVAGSSPARPTAPICDFAQSLPFPVGWTTEFANGLPTPEERGPSAASSARSALPWAVLPCVLVDGNSERGIGVAEDGRHDHRVHPSSPEFGGDGVPDVVQPCAGRHPGLTGQSLECTGERVGVQGEAVPPIADQGDGPTELVEWIAPQRARGPAVFELLLAVSVHPFQGEGRQMEQPVRPFGFERGEHDGPSTLGPRHRLKTRRMKTEPVCRSTSPHERPRISARRAPVTQARVNDYTRGVARLVHFEVATCHTSWVRAYEGGLSSHLPCPCRVRLRGERIAS